MSFSQRLFTFESLSIHGARVWVGLIFTRERERDRERERHRESKREREIHIRRSDGSIPCHVCKQTLPNFTALCKHFCHDHGWAMKDLHGSYVHKQHLVEIMKPPKISPLEVENVAACYEDETKFRCRTCDKAFSKMSAEAHFLKVHSDDKAHPVDMTAVKGWVVVRDGTCMRNGYPERMQLSNAMPEEVAAEALGSHEGDDEGGEKGEAELQGEEEWQEDWEDEEEWEEEWQDAEEGEKEAEWCSDDKGGADAAPRNAAPGTPPATAPRIVIGGLSPLLRSVGNLVSAMAGPAADPGAAATSQQRPLLVLEILKDWREWTPPAAWLDENNPPERRECPLHKATPPFDVSGFERYLLKQLRLDNEETVKPHMTSLQRLVGMFEPLPSGTSVVEFVAAFHSQQLHDELFSLPVLNEEFGWSRTVFSVLKHFASYAKVEAMRRRQDEHKRDIELLQDSFKGTTLLHSESRDTSGVAKQLKDAQRIEQMPSSAERHAAVTQMMCDLWHLQQRTAGKEDLTAREWSGAQQLLMNIFYHNGKFGRCGEAFTLKTQDMIATIMKEKKDYVSCNNHKTAKKRGPAVKTFAPGTVKALEVFLQLPGSDKREFLFQSVKGKKGGQTAADMLKAVDLKMFGRVCHFGTNLCRKSQETDTKEQAADHYRKLSAWSGMHGFQVTEQVYVSMTAKKRAELDRKLIEIEVQPVPWPSDAELAAAPVVFWKKALRKSSKSHGLPEDEKLADEAAPPEDEGGDGLSPLGEQKGKSERRGRGEEVRGDEASSALAKKQKTYSKEEMIEVICACLLKKPERRTKFEARVAANTGFNVETLGVAIGPDVVREALAEFDKRSQEKKDGNEKGAEKGATEKRDQAAKGKEESNKTKAKEAAEGERAEEVEERAGTRKRKAAAASSVAEGESAEAGGGKEATSKGSATARGRYSPFTEEEKAWILNAGLVYRPAGVIFTIPNSCLRAILESGIAERKESSERGIPEGTTIDQLRQVLRQ